MTTCKIHIVRIVGKGLTCIKTSMGPKSVVWVRGWHASLKVPPGSNPAMNHPFLFFFPMVHGTTPSFSFSPWFMAGFDGEKEMEGVVCGRIWTPFSVIRIIMEDIFFSSPNRGLLLCLLVISQTGKKKRKGWFTPFSVIVGGSWWDLNNYWR